MVVFNTTSTQSGKPFALAPACASSRYLSLRASFNTSLLVEVVAAKEYPLAPLTFSCPVATSIWLTLVLMNSMVSSIAAICRVM